MNVEIRTEAAQFPEKEYINGISVAVYDTDTLVWTKLYYGRMVYLEGALWLTFKMYCLFIRIKVGKNNNFI